MHQSAAKLRHIVTIFFTRICKFICVLKMTPDHETKHRLVAQNTAQVENDSGLTGFFGDSNALRPWTFADSTRSSKLYRISFEYREVVGIAKK